MTEEFQEENKGQINEPVGEDSSQDEIRVPEAPPQEVINETSNEDSQEQALANTSEERIE